MRAINIISPIVNLPTEYGEFKALSFSLRNDNKEHFVLMKNIKKILF